jgi:hypothetical protein
MRSRRRCGIKPLRRVASSYHCAAQRDEAGRASSKARKKEERRKEIRKRARKTGRLLLLEREHPD